VKCDGRGPGPICVILGVRWERRSRDGTPLPGAGRVVTVVRARSQRCSDWTVGTWGQHCSMELPPVQSSPMPAMPGPAILEHCGSLSPAPPLST
jgi:hypothetical protein